VVDGRKSKSCHGYRKEPVTKVGEEGKRRFDSSFATDKQDYSVGHWATAADRRGKGKEKGRTQGRRTKWSGGERISKVRADRISLCDNVLGKHILGLKKRGRNNGKKGWFRLGGGDFNGPGWGAREKKTPFFAKGSDHKPQIHSERTGGGN